MKDLIYYPGLQGNSFYRYSRRNMVACNKIFFWRTEKHAVIHYRENLASDILIYEDKHGNTYIVETDKILDLV